jgi:O-succinylbenzoic acid--CoA ligase
MVMIEIPSNVIVSAELENVVLSFLSEWQSANKVIRVKTSGSTGAPKEIVLSKNGVIASAQNTIQFFNLSTDTRALLCLPLTTIGGKMMLVRALQSSMQLHIQNPSSNPLKSFTFPIDFIAVTPMQLKVILDESELELKKIRSVLVGGGPISSELELQLTEKEITVYHSYGMTETASHVALRRVGFDGEDFYKALPGIHFSVHENQALAISFSALKSELIQTTDQVELLSETSFRWLGRNDFVINSGGVKIHPEEIERLLSQQISIPFFISSLPDQTLGERVILFIESEENISLDFNSDFPKYGQPKEVICLPKFSYTPSGKIDRRLTRKYYLELKQ